MLFDLALDYAGCTRIALARAAQASEKHFHHVVGFFASLGKKASLVADTPGMMVMRTVAMLVDEAAEAVHQGIATAEDVDAAMQKGVNYPIGPLGWGRAVGLERIAEVLRHLALAYGEDRYRCSPWLQREVQSLQPLAGNRR